MASRKVLKRDIDYMTSELLSDCVLYVDLYPAQPTEPVTEIINNVLLKKQEVFSKINTPTSKMEKKAVKENYKGQLIAGVAGTVYKNNLGIGMPQQDTYKFTGGITGTSYYSYFYHFFSGITRAQIR